MGELRILTLNVWAIPHISKDIDVRLRAIGDALVEGNYDIVGLQELWCDSEYQTLCEIVRDVLPYSHHFISGLLSSGCATFSRFPIVDSVFYKYVFNGYYWDLSHLDWYGGNGLSCCVIKHPTKAIHFFNTQLHASYEYQGESPFRECRTLQAYQVTQFLKHSTRPEDAIIMTGDFNHEPHELGTNCIKELTNLRDTFDIALIKAESCFTYDSTVNKVYISSNEPPQRIDYIYVSRHFDCVSCRLTMQQIPGKNIHYSDHEGFEATMGFAKDAGDISSVKKSMDTRMKTLGQVLNMMTCGRELSSEIPWFKTILLFVLFSLFILCPLIGVVSLPGSEVWYGKLVNLFQLILFLTSGIYTWTFTIVRKYDMNSFSSIEREIQCELDYLKSK